MLSLQLTYIQYRAPVGVELPAFFAASAVRPRAGFGYWLKVYTVALHVHAFDVRDKMAVNPIHRNLLCHTVCFDLYSETDKVNMKLIGTHIY